MTKADHHWCRLYLDLKGKLSAKQKNEVRNIAHAVLQGASPALAGKIAEVHAVTAKQHRYDTEKNKKLKSGHLFKSFYIVLEVDDATIRQVDRLLEKTVPILLNNLIAEGFVVNGGWGERLKITKAKMMG